MRCFLKIIVLSLIFFSCKKEVDSTSVKKINWEIRQSNISNFSDYYQGKTYLPVYSHIYHTREHKTFDLTITISIRNVLMKDSIYILKADYYNTVGDNIRQYIKKPIYLKPMETIEIIIDEKDLEGGSGANFMFDWAMKNDLNPPLFEAVMISTYGQQGLSFTTRGVNVFE